MTYNEKQKEYTMKYLEKLKEIRFRVKPEEFERYEEAAKKAGYPSMRQFYMDAISEKELKLLMNFIKDDLTEAKESDKEEIKNMKIERVLEHIQQYLED